MAQLCYDQCDHSVLWCGAKGRTEEKRIADENWTLVQQRREQKEAQKIRDCNEVSHVQMIE